MSNYSATHQIAYAKLVNLNAVGDTQIFIPFARIQITAVKVCNASKSLAASAATLGLYTLPAAAGVAVVTPATLTTLTTADKVVNATIASSDLITTTSVPTVGGTTLYLRCAVVDGAAATVDVLIEALRFTSQG